MSRPKDKLKVLPDPRNCNKHYLVTDEGPGKVGLRVGVIDCIVGEAFANALVETWNKSLEKNET